MGIQWQKNVLINLYDRWGGKNTRLQLEMTSKRELKVKKTSIVLTNGRRKLTFRRRNVWGNGWGTYRF